MFFFSPNRKCIMSGATSSNFLLGCECSRSVNKQIGTDLVNKILGREASLEVKGQIFAQLYQVARLATRVLVVASMTFMMTQQRTRTICNPKLIAIFTRLENT